MKKRLFQIPPLLCLLWTTTALSQMRGTVIQGTSVLTSNLLPFKITAVETPESKECKEIKNKAVSFLQAKDYDKLDEFIIKLRTSRESRPNGQWKLAAIYAGFALGDEATDGEWKARLLALQDWVSAKPSSIGARVSLAYFLTDYAWRARGDDWADKVTDQGWKLFEQRLNQASGVLDKAQKLKEKCPVYWSVRMKIRLGLGAERNDFDSIFQQATNSAPYYDPYYSRRAMFLLPRWHGNEGEWESDLAKSADRIGGEHGDEVYAQVVWCMHSLFSNVFEENKLSWPRVKRGFEIIGKKYPGNLTVINEGAHLAVLARDLQTAQKYFEQTQGKMDSDNWKTESDFTRFAIRAYSN